jgi:hypothetical protein
MTPVPMNAIEWEDMAERNTPAAGEAMPKLKPPRQRAATRGWVRTILQGLWRNAFWSQNMYYLDQSTDSGVLFAQV